MRQQRPAPQPGKSTLTQDAAPPVAIPGKRTRSEAIGPGQVDAGRPGAAAQSQRLLEASHQPTAERGRALPEPLQRKMGDALNADFSGVSVHEGPRAQSLGALAYAQGDQLHFAPGQYDPSSQAGQQLIGHELAHVVQQRQGRAGGAQAKGLPVSDDPALEREADDRGARAARGELGEGPRADGPVGAPVIQGYLATNTGTAMLVTNPQQPMEGPMRWLEDHTQIEKLELASFSGLAWVRVQVTTGSYAGKQGWLLASWVTEYQEPEPGVELIEFCNQLCAHRATILSKDGMPHGMNPHRVMIERIYKMIYERGERGRTEKQPLTSYSGVVSTMVQTANKFGGKLQFPAKVEGAGNIDDLAQLWSYSQDRQFTGKVDAYNALLYGAYYVTLQNGESNGRIIINVGPGQVAGSFQEACAIAKQSPCAVAVKAFGPGECLRKLDSLLVYVRRTEGNNAVAELVAALQSRGLPGATLTPMMTQEIAPGMAYAEEPSQVEHKPISFGQKRCILGYMAISQATDLQDCTRKLADLFRRAGIDVMNPSRELGQAEPNIAQQLSIYLGLLS